MNTRTITGIATAALATTAGVSVANTLQKQQNPSEGVVQAATTTPQAQQTQQAAATRSGQSNQQQFLDKAIPAATTASSKYGTYTSVMIAQAALESGWGQSTLSKEPNNNLFGIKGSYNGQSVNMATSEYGPNGYYTVNQNFRKYPSYTESFGDNGALLRNGLTGNNSYYSGAWVENASSATQATANGLQGKYATAPNYSQQLNSIINAYGLQKYDPVTTKVNETKVVQQDTQITAGPVDPTVVGSIGIAKKGTSVNVTTYITYNNGVKYALSNLGWLNATAFATTSSQAPVLPNNNQNNNNTANNNNNNTNNNSNIQKPTTPAKPETPTYKVTPVNEVVRIAGVEHLDVLNTPAGTPTGQKLARNTRWKVSGYTTVNNIRYNKVGTNQWINDQYCSHNSFIEPGTTTPTTKPSTDSDIKITAVNDVARVNYVPGWGIAVWKEPAKHTTGVYLPTDSRWKVSASASVNNNTWYKVGTNQWIDSKYAILESTEKKEPAKPTTPAKPAVDTKPSTETNKDNNVTTTPIKSSGVVTINYRDDAGVTVWSRPGGTPTGKYLQNKTSWRYFNILEAYGETWFNLGGNQWVPKRYLFVR